MKKVEAFIRHEAFEPIRMELLSLGFPSLSIMEVKGSGRQKGITERYRGAELTNYLRPKVKIECVVATGDVQTVVDTILKHARTGSIGDGKVFVLPVDEAYRIRTGESGEETLQAHPDVAAEAERGSRRDHVAAAQPVQPAVARSLVERLRAVHLEMVDAVLGGDGLGRVAELAADAAGGARRDRRPAARRRGRLAGRGGTGRPRGRCAATSPTASKDRPAGPCPAGRPRPRSRSRSGDEVIGCVLLLGAGGRAAPEATEFLHLAAVASLTEVAVEEAKEEVEQNLRGSFLEELRAEPDELDPHEVVRRAARLGCDLARGAVVLCAELSTDRPRHVVATIAGEHPGALAQHMELPGDAPRVYALLPAAGGDEAPRGDARGRAPARDAAPAPRHGGALELLRRPGRARPRDPGGRARARRPAPLGRRRSPRTSAPARTGCCSACWPRTRRRSARSTTTRSRRSSSTTTSTRPTSSGRSRPTSSRTAT